MICSWSNFFEPNLDLSNIFNLPNVAEHVARLEEMAWPLKCDEVLKSGGFEFETLIFLDIETFLK